jgi:hypothetical protein
MISKKRSSRYLWISISSNSNSSSKKEFTIISTGESFFFYDSLVRRVWIDKENKRPVVE